MRRVSFSVFRFKERGTMKKTYEELELEVIRFSAEDIITSSAAGNNDYGQCEVK